MCCLLKEQKRGQRKVFSCPKWNEIPVTNSKKYDLHFDESGGKHVLSARS